MPLARTPPEKGNVPKRQHTFGPLQAFPDGTPLPPEPDTPSMATASSSQRSQPDPTPTRKTSGTGRPAMLVPQPSLQPLEEGDTVEEMEIEEGLRGAERGDGDREGEMDVDNPPPSQIEPEPLAQPEPQTLPPSSQPSSHPQSSQPGPSRPRPSQRRPSRAPPSPPHTQPDQLEPTTPRRRSRRVTVNPQVDSPPETLRPPPNAFSTPRPSDAHDAPTPGRLTRAATPAGTTREQLLATPAVPLDDDAETRHGRYYEALVRPLRIQTLGQGIGRLTLDQMAQCYPLIADETPDGLRAVWESTLEQIRRDALDGAYALFGDYGVGRRLQQFADTVDEGIRWKRERPGESRPDAWQPDLTPQVRSTASNLPVYDESWSVLRKEYLALTKECGERLQRVEEKRARLASLDNGVSEAVLELGKTNAFFEHFPTTAMLEWAEDVGAE